MEDLSLHVMDIVENSINAGATVVKIELSEDRQKDLLEIVIQDNGSGMNKDTSDRARDPFFTTRTTRRVGMGLALLEQAAREANGELSMVSKPAHGTEVRAKFQASHIDRKPIGDMASTMISLIVGNPEVDFLYRANIEEATVELDTREIKAELGGIDSLTDPAFIKVLREVLKGG